MVECGSGFAFTTCHDVA